MNKGEHMRAPDDDRLDDALLHAKQERPVGEGVVVALDELVRSLESEDVRRRAERELLATRRGGRQRWQFAVPAAILGLVVAIPVGATAIGSWTARTGELGGRGSDIVDRSEWIGLDADDAPEAVVELYSGELDLPDGASGSDVINPVGKLLAEMGVVPDGESGHVMIQTTTIQGMFESAARCLWYREWLDADLNDDENRRNAATAGIQAALTWPATSATDGGGVVGNLKVQAEAARAGDRGLMLTFYEISCETFYGRVSR